MIKSQELVDMLLEVYSEHYQTSNIELFVEVVNGLKENVKRLKVNLFSQKLHLRCLTAF